MVAKIKNVLKPILGIKRSAVLALTKFLFLRRGDYDYQPGGTSVISTGRLLKTLLSFSLGKPPTLQYLGNTIAVYQSDIIRAALRVPMKSVITMRGLETANYRAWLSIEPGSIHISEQYQGQRVYWDSMLTFEI